MEQAIEVALETGCRIHSSQEGVTRKEILEFVKKVLYFNNVLRRITCACVNVCQL